MKHRIVLLCIPMLLAFSACGFQTYGNYFAPTAAVVNGSKIPESKISLQLKRVVQNPQTAAQFHGPKGPTNRLDAQREILNNLIQQELVIQQAGVLHISIKPNEIATQLKALQARYKSKAEFDKTVEKEGLTLDQVRDFLHDQILLQRVASQVTKSATPSDEELTTFYNTSKQSFDAQVHVAHILICGNFDQTARTCAFTPEDEATANSISQRAKAGEDFAGLAKQSSKDPSTAQTGGDLGWLTKGAGYPPDFENAAFSMNAGDISAPIKTQFGFHIIKVIAKGKTFEDAKAELQQSLGRQRQQEAYQAWLNKQLSSANVRVNPRLGRYDSTSHTVVANPGGFTTSTQKGSAAGG